MERHDLSQWTEHESTKNERAVIIKSITQHQSKLCDKPHLRSPSPLPDIKPGSLPPKSGESKSTNGTYAAPKNFLTVKKVHFYDLE